MKKKDIPDFWKEFKTKIDELEYSAQKGLEFRYAKATLDLDNYINDILYQKIENNWILSSQTLCEMLDIYVCDKLQIEKAYKVVELLVRYYRDDLENKMQVWIKEEKYENCKALKTILFSL